MREQIQKALLICLGGAMCDYLLTHIQLWVKLNFFDKHD